MTQGQLGGVSPSGFASGGVSGAGGGGSSAFGSGGGGGVAGFSFAAKNAASSLSVRSGALPSIAACVSFGFGMSRRGLRGGGGGGGGGAGFSSRRCCSRGGP